MPNFEIVYATCGANHFSSIASGGLSTIRPMMNAAITPAATLMGYNRRRAKGNVIASSMITNAGVEGVSIDGSCPTISNVVETDTIAAAARSTAMPASVAVGWRRTPAATRRATSLMVPTVPDLRVPAVGPGTNGPQG